MMHPSAKHILQYFKSSHLREAIREPAEQCGMIAHQMARDLPSNPETTAGLRKLLEAKDCFVRALLSEEEELQASPEMEEFRIVFDGPPGPEGGRFVEVEVPDGYSISAGEWNERNDGLWELCIPRPAQ